MNETVFSRSGLIEALNQIEPQPKIFYMLGATDGAEMSIHLTSCRLSEVLDVFGIESLHRWPVPLLRQIAAIAVNRPEHEGVLLRLFAVLGGDDWDAEMREVIKVVNAHPEPDREIGWKKP